ncbi:hypothetical protein AB0I60_08060 [Actinosynnema sp. NPDC050436]|uniref:hypothetical protein n=1 Tax=Actinosynnema sp. NPDC050436 TaxID=3155659 RepID=UPI0033FC8DEE
MTAADTGRGSTTRTGLTADTGCGGLTADTGRGTARGGLTADERAELAWLRSENTFLRAQRDVLVRIATGYADDMDALLRRRGPVAH